MIKYKSKNLRKRQELGKQTENTLDTNDNKLKTARQNKEEQAVQNRKKTIENAISTKQALAEISSFSPMMQHYLETKSKHIDTVLFYRLGDFYEMFFDDAINVARELELTLTGKECGREDRAPMCGIPYHAGEIYATKLIAKGYKVAICEQLEDPKNAKGIVKRDVIKIMTPGTITDGNLLDETQNNFIMSIYKEGLYFGIAICDISTGEFLSTQINEDNNFSKLIDEISRFNPSEIIVNPMMNESLEEVEEIKLRFNSFISVDKPLNKEIETLKKEDDFIPDIFNSKSSIGELDTKFDLETIKNTFEIYDYNGEKIEEFENYGLAISAIGMLLKYIEETQKTKPNNLNKITIYKTTKYMTLDISARRNLELVEKLRDKTKRGTLLWVLDKTSTSMGGRLLRRWISDPLIDKNEINLRLDGVEELKKSPILRDDLRESLKNVYDIERLAGKISYGTANARDLTTLKSSISMLPEILHSLSRTESKILVEMHDNLDVLDDIYELIDTAIVDEPPMTIKEGGLIKKGYNPDIDELLEATTNGKLWLTKLEADEREKTGIKNLKISYNKVFGYYIEVTKSFLSQVPKDRYIRKQTLTTGERFITDELKSMEDKIVGAQERIINLEYDIFVKIRNQIKENAKRLQNAANIVSNLDVLCSLAQVAEDMNYVKPEVDESSVIDIKDGRHPVIEKILPSGDFVENDIYLDSEEARLNIITGPNMAGKSTYMRQAALITLMAQIGSFVPASYAHIGVVDKIFTRIGASDDLAMGESTFMVEMKEVSSILKNATPKSLVILDEIGRGTSTYDGLSIAWAVAEYISKLHAKTLFATHYHELVDLEGKLEGTKNYHVTVKERGEDVIFLRKIVPGGTDESYGIHVAKLAGLPKETTKRANDILRTMERKSILRDTKKAKSNTLEEETPQLNLYNYKLAEIAHELDQVKLEEITPIDALNILQKIKDKMK